MCGILGFGLRVPFRRVSAVFGDALRSLAHRGPDADGRYVFEWDSSCAGLGHRRLAILDLSRHGVQPFVSEDDRYRLVCNGEIYNAAVLRRQLVAIGHRFRSNSDSEVVLHGYESWGVDVLKRLDGMFAFAIWDEQRRRLVVARDRVGIKPLLYALNESGLIFASELSSLIGWPGVDGTLDIDGLRQYLSFGYTLTPTTLLRDVRKLEPGNYLQYDLDRHRLKQRCYWSLPDVFHAGAERARSHPPRAEGELVDDLWQRLTTAVDERLTADVPVGSFLSSGLDSAVITALASSRFHATPMQAFCCDFSERSYAEGTGAAASAHELGVDLHTHLMSAPTEDAIENILATTDEPTADTSFVAYHALSEIAGRSIKVALSGDGADELFAGYVTYQANDWHRQVRRLPHPLRSLIAGRIAPLLRPGSTKVGFAFKLRQFLLAADASAEYAHAAWRTLWQESELEGLLDPARATMIRGLSANPADRIRRQFLRVKGLPFEQQALYVDCSTWLVDDVLHKVDRASMAHGLEVRVPFLDHRFVEWSAALPFEYKRRGATGKWLLRRAVRDRVPELRLGQRKRGFNSPTSHWLRGSLRGWAEELIQDAATLSHGWLSSSGLHVDVFREHQQRTRDHGFRLWGLLSLLAWFRRIDALRRHRRKLAFDPVGSER